MCKITVAIPVYNCENTLQKCLDSVINQSFKDIEILLINDGSPDNSEEICLDYMKKDERIKYIRRENGGLASVRNLALSKAQGEYLCFVDSDDYIDADALSFMYEKAEKEQCDIVLCGYFTENGDAQQRVIYVGEKGDALDLKELKAKNLIDPAWNKLYRLDFLKKTGVKFPEGEYYEDTFFNLSLMPFNPKITVYEECFYHYVLNMGSITRRYNKEKLSTIKDRARLLKSVTNGIDSYCDFYFIKCVFSSFIDMFFSLTKKKIKAAIKKEISNAEFKNCAKNAFYKGRSSRIIIKTAQSGRVGAIYNFCKLSFFLKYKMQKTFLRVKNK